MNMNIPNRIVAVADIVARFLFFLELDSTEGHEADAVGGLVAITPASGFVGPIGALGIGIAAGYGCYFAVVKVKISLDYDDSLDVFGVHAVGGVIGAILTGLFVDSALGGVGLTEGVTVGSQVFLQFVGVLVTIVYCAVVSFIILKVLDSILGLRVSDPDEEEGLDISLHDEQGYNL